MRVKMQMQITGTRDGAYWPAPGGEVDLPAHEAAKMIAAGSAMPVIETATAPEVKTATVPKRGRRA